MEVVNFLEDYTIPDAARENVKSKFCSFFKENRKQEIENRKQGIENRKQENRKFLKEIEFPPIRQVMFLFGLFVCFLSIFEIILPTTVYFLISVSGEDINPVCLFKFIVNPHSFGQTIENLFHLSFLVRVSKTSFCPQDFVVHFSSCVTNSKTK